MFEVKRVLKNSTALIAVLGALATFGSVAHALTVRDDVTVEGSEALADNPAYDGAVQIYLWDTDGSVLFNCSGSLMNHRTVISAAHCFNSLPSSAYGDVRDGTTVTPIIAYGPDTFDALFNWIDTDELVVDERNGLTFGNQVIVHPDADFGALAFPAADLAMISLADPLDQLPSYGVLFSQAPVGSHVVQVAYGQDGTGSGGLVDTEGKRQAGENIIGLVASQNDFINGIFPGSDFSFGFAGSAQTLYWIDFDNPDRTGDECSRDPTFGDYVCDGSSFATALDGVFLVPSTEIDYYPGDALPNEAGTAPGDSGSPIFFDELTDQLLIGGVLSGGFGFTTPVASGYGDVSFYNPLFNFHQFVSEFNPYKYVSAQAGDGNWSDPSHWVQDLDPGYFIIDENGNVVNGLPDGDEVGVQDETPAQGVVLDTDITETTEASTTSTSLDPTNDRLDTKVGEASKATATPSSTEATTDATPELNTVTEGDVGTGGPASGPGATGFVPDNGFNDDGYINYFDVTLSEAGTTTADIDATVDRLTISNPDATLVVASTTTLTAILDTRVTAGTLDVDGNLVSRDVLNFGMLRGAGAISAETVWNGGMLLTEGLSITGDLILTSAGVVVYNGQPVAVDGDVSVDGAFTAPQAQFGDTGTVITYTGESIGTFSDTELPGVLFSTVTDTDGVIAFEVDAIEFSTLLGPTASTAALLGGGLLDDDRDENFDQLTDIYGVLDTLEGAELEAALESLVPIVGGSLGVADLVGSEALQSQLSARIHQIISGTADGVTTNGGGGLGGIGLGASNIGMELNALMANATALSEAPASQAAPGRGVFLQFTYQDGEADAALGNSGDVSGYTLTAGGDINVSPTARLGAFVSYSEGDNDFNVNLGSSDTESIVLGAYGVAEFLGANASGYIGFGDRDMSTVRGALGSTISGDTSADEIIIGGAISRSYPVANGAIAIAPLVTADYFSYGIDGYTEQGGSAALQIDGRDVSSFQIGLGADALLYDTSVGANPAFRPVIGVSYITDIDGERDPLVGRLIGGGQNLVLTSPSVDENWVELRGAATWLSNNGFQASVFVEQTVGRSDLEYTSVGLSGRFTF